MILMRKALADNVGHDIGDENAGRWWWWQCIGEAPHPLCHWHVTPNPTRCKHTNTQKNQICRNMVQGIECLKWIKQLIPPSINLYLSLNSRVNECVRVVILDPANPCPHTYLPSPRITSQTHLIVGHPGTLIQWVLILSTRAVVRLTATLGSTAGSVQDLSIDLPAPRAESNPQ